MPKKILRSFYIVVRDDDRQEFEILGPMGDDRPVNDAVVEAQEQGRRLRCQTVEPDNFDSAIEWAKSQGLKKASGLLRMQPSPTMLYKGTLPAYAEQADRGRVVQLLCKGKCRRTVWAEMTAPYPGTAALKKAGVLQFEAKCLRCGEIAADPYNWLGRPGE